MEYEVYVVGATDDEWGARASAALGRTRAEFVDVEDDEGVWRGTVWSNPGRAEWIEQRLLAIDDVEVHVVGRLPTQVSAGGATRQSLHSGAPANLQGDHHGFGASHRDASTAPRTYDAAPVMDATYDRDRIEDALSRCKPLDDHLAYRRRDEATIDAWRRQELSLHPAHLPTLVSLVGELDRVALSRAERDRSDPWRLDESAQHAYVVLFYAVWQLVQSPESAPYIPHLHAVWSARVRARRELVHRRAAESLGVPYDEWRAGAQRKLERALGEQLVSVRADSNVVETIIDDGRFKSQFETATSKGANAPMQRAENEMWLHGVPPYLRQRRRMVYGFLDDPSEARGAAVFYGNVQIVLDPRVCATTTWTGGDSLGLGTPNAARIPQMLASPLLAPELASAESSALVADGEPLARTYSYNELQFHRGIATTDIAGISERPSRGGLRSRKIREWCSANGIPYSKAESDDSSFEQRSTEELRFLSGLPRIGGTWSHLSGDD